MPVMTEEEVYQAMAFSSGCLSPEEWADFCALDAYAQAAVAQLYKDAIFSKSGPGGWEVFMNVLKTAAELLGPATGIATAYSTFKALL